MDAAQVSLWHERRSELFRTKIPYPALAVINEAIPKLDYARAIAALNDYAQELPYKGFYLNRFLVHYNRTPVGQGQDRRSPEAPAACPAPFDVASEEERDQRLYDLIPENVREEYRTRFRDYGWEYGSRQWQILCIEAYKGESVEKFKVHPGWFTPAGQERHHAAQVTAEARLLELQTLVERLRLEILKRDEVIAAQHRNERDAICARLDIIEREEMRRAQARDTKGAGNG